MSNTSSTEAVLRLAANDLDAVKKWEDFVFSCPSATFFHRAPWQTVINKIYKHDTYFLYAVFDGSIEGVLPLAHIKSFLFGNSLISLPFAVYGGIASVSDRAFLALEDEARKLSLELGVDTLEFRNFELQHADWPRQDLYVTFRKEIFSSEEENMLSIPRKQRAMVRKAIKNDLFCEVDSDVHRFFQLYADNVHRHGTPAMPKKYFAALKLVFGDDCEILTVIGPDGRLLSSVMSFYFKNEVLPYYAGDAMAARELAANDYKYWELLRRAAIRGVKIFDFGRSKKGTGSYSFKKNWGFEPTVLSYEYVLYKRDSIPQNNPSNAKYRFLIATWRRMPVAMANFIGPFVVRNLG